VRNRDGSPEAALEEGGDRNRAGDRFQAAAIAAATDRPAGISQHMADLARDAEPTLVGMAVDDEAGTDARGQADVDQIVDSAGGTERLLSNGAAQLVQTTSDNQNIDAKQITQVLATIPTAGVLTSNTVSLAIDKVGARYTTYYSTDGVHFTPIYNVGASLSNVRVGLFAWNGPASTSDLQVAFQHFHIFNGAAGFARP
jgi:hypothetical protein